MTALLGACGGSTVGAPGGSGAVDSVAPTTQVDIQLRDAAFEVVGWQPPASPLHRDQDWSKLFSVYAGQADVPPLLGRYDIESGRLVFRPQYALAAGLAYRAVLRLPGAPPIERVFETPAPDRTSSTRVLNVYPSGGVLPSNQLRLYVQFSAPMSRGEAGAYLHMLDAQGHVLEGVFLPAEELWDPNYQWLTMTFDPGRIKRGLTSNQALGPPIEPGQHYELVIDRAWHDARGNPLLAGYKKSFVGGPELRTPPDPAQWHLVPPHAGTTERLTLEFQTPMNYPLLGRMLRVTHAGQPVGGTVSVEDQERRWCFTPSQAWTSGDYQLVVDRALEDVAGNEIGQTFDIDAFQRVTQHILTQSISLPFTAR